MGSYEEFLETKRRMSNACGFDSSDYWMPEEIKPFQQACVKWALTRGRGAIFADTGLGKTLMQLAWANCVAEHTGRPVLVCAPLCVAQQTVREGVKFGIVVRYVRSQESVTKKGVYICNYEMLSHFDSSEFAGIVLDESSILKGMQGKIRKFITEFSKPIDYRLSCTATPSPNDHMELGTQSEFLGVMSQVEMLATYFIHDGSDTSKWRLKGHGRAKFWEWVSTWSLILRKPDDIGFESTGYDLPELKIIEHVIQTDAEEQIFVEVASGLKERLRARRDSAAVRCEYAADLMKDWDCGIAWCNLNDESDAMAKLLPDSVNVYGSMDFDKKESAILAFTDGEIKKIITKPKIAGFGLNWQHCNKMCFVGLTDSFESFYQSIRRSWRYGQDKPVFAHLIISDKEILVLDNIKRKQAAHNQMINEVVAITKHKAMEQIHGFAPVRAAYEPKVEVKLPSFLGAK
jgi:superfamily II DNA or RNA helicase